MRSGKKACLWLVVVWVVGLGACSDDAKKKVGDPCAHNTDCEDEICHVGECASKNPLKDGEACSLDAQCRSFNCSGGVCAAGTRPLGDHCRYNVECLSNVCQIEGSLPGLCVADKQDPDGAVPDSAPDAGPDQALPDTALPDTALPDAPLPDAPLPDKALPDKALPDQSWPDQMWPDAPPPDLGPCGNKNEPCCGSLCNAPLACVSGTCVCGAKDQPCCSGDVCEANLTCAGTTTKICACGAVTQACCGGTTCSGTLFCTGKACACIKQIDTDHYVRTDGTIWDKSGTYSQPITVAGPLLQGMTHVVGGQYHGCGRKSDGTVWCWGRSTNSNNAGQLGNGTLGGITTAHNASQVTVAPSGLLTGVASISAAGSGGYGVSTTCAVKTDGTLWCWGSAQSGSTGGLFQKINDTAKPRATQIKASATTMLTNVKQVSTKYRHACAVVGTGVACWGINVFGNLGAGDTAAHLYPVLVTISGKTVKKVAVGTDVSCALTTSNEVYCWGANNQGQCGLGYNSTAVTGPVQVAQNGGGYLTGVKELAAGHLLACVIKTDGSLWCWGNTTLGNKATQMLDKNSAPINDAVLLTTDTPTPDYRILKTNGEYWKDKNALQTYSCP